MSQQIKVRHVNEKNLRELSEQQLQERIKVGERKLEAKKMRYETQAKLNIARLEAYRSFRTAELETCRRLLAEKSKNNPVPKGNAVLPTGIAKAA